eukprot:3222513-Prymnesium_polylepis.1
MEKRLLRNERPGLWRVRCATLCCEEQRFPVAPHPLQRNAWRGRYAPKIRECRARHTVPPVGPRLGLGSRSPKGVG